MSEAEALENVEEIDQETHEETPPEKSPENEKPTAVEMARIEEIASQQGWSSEGELDALDYLANGRMYRDRLYKKVEELKGDNDRAYKVIADYIQTQKKRDHAQDQKSIEDQIRVAMENDDTERVIQLSKQLSEPPKAERQPDVGTKYAEEWANKQKWFNENPDMRDDAIAFYQAEIMRLGRDDPQAILPKVEERIKKVYPKYFNPENPNRTRGAGAEKTGKQKTTIKGLSVDDLTPDERAHIQDFVKMGMSEEKLLRSIQNARKRI